MLRGLQREGAGEGSRTRGQRVLCRLRCWGTVPNPWL